MDVEYKAAVFGELGEIFALLLPHNDQPVSRVTNITVLILLNARIDW